MASPGCVCLADGSDDGQNFSVQQNPSVTSLSSFNWLEISFGIDAVAIDVPVFSPVSMGPSVIYSLPLF